MSLQNLILGVLRNSPGFLKRRLAGAPVEIDGRAEIQEGFKNHIVTNLQQAGEHFSEVQLAIDEAKGAMTLSKPAKRALKSS